MTPRRQLIDPPHLGKPGACCWCAGPLPKRKRAWCSDQCVDQYLVRKGDTNRIRAILFRRDRGICAACGLDTVALRQRWDGLRKRAYRAGSWDRHRNWLLGWARASGFSPNRADWWDADHVVPVQQGGGGCGIENFQTLCQRCHKAKTAAQAALQARRHKLSKQPELFEQPCAAPSKPLPQN